MPFDFRKYCRILFGGARVDVVGAQQDNRLAAAALLAHQVLDRRDGLLVRGRAGVKDVERRLFAFVLDRVEQQDRSALETPQHRLARDRRPAAEGDGHLLVLDQVAGLLGEQRPFDAGSTTTGSSLRPRTPPAALISSIVIRATSFSEVSLIAMVPDK